MSRVIHSRQSVEKVTGFCVVLKIDREPGCSVNRARGTGVRYTYDGNKVRNRNG